MFSTGSNVIRENVTSAVQISVFLIFLPEMTRFRYDLTADCDIQIESDVFPVCRYFWSNNEISEPDVTFFLDIFISSTI